MKSYAARENAEYDERCRRCGKPRETVGHILGECTHIKAKRIRRHDEIKELIAEKLSKGNQVLLEQTFEAAGERLKPDVVVISNHSRATIIDVTVRYENGQSLAKAAKEKIVKYERIKSSVREGTKVVLRSCFLKENRSWFRPEKMQKNPIYQCLSILATCGFGGN